MSAKVLLLVGTKKGGFILESDAGRQEWRLREPVSSWLSSRSSCGGCRRLAAGS